MTRRVDISQSLREIRKRLSDHRRVLNAHGRSINAIKAERVWFRKTLIRILKGQTKLGLQLEQVLELKQEMDKEFAAVHVHLNRSQLGGK